MRNLLEMGEWLPSGKTVVSILVVLAGGGVIAELLRVLSNRRNMGADYADTISAAAVRLLEPLQAQIREMSKQLESTALELRQTKQELNLTKVELRHTKNEMHQARAELNDARDEVRGLRQQMIVAKEDFEDQRELDLNKEE